MIINGKYHKTDFCKTNNIASAEAIADLLYLSDNLNLNPSMKEALCKIRYEIQCKNSPIGAHKCSVEIQFTPQGEQKSICVDACLRTEIQTLIREYEICTIGSCCGHGVKQPFIQVADHCVRKMIELGYKQLPIDEHGNGKNCFEPKTILYISKDDQTI